MIPAKLPISKRLLARAAAARGTGLKLADPRNPRNLSDGVPNLRRDRETAGQLDLDVAMLDFEMKADADPPAATFDTVETTLDSLQRALPSWASAMDISKPGDADAAAASS